MSQKITEMLESRNNQRILRTITTEYKVREDESEPIIEGYFAVFNSTYDMGWDMHESIAPGAFTKALSGDVRALFNHDTNLVLGRTSAHTLELREDAHGLWGRIRINPNDTDAMNAYQRIKRGDVSGCSFGFNITDEETEYRDDGSVWFTIREVVLHEISPCTFPAYESTNVTARNQATHEELQKRSLDAWKIKMTNKLKGVAE